MNDNTRPAGQSPWSGESPSWGIWANYASPHVMGSLAASGAPWLCIDEQHGFAPAELAASIWAARSQGTRVLVRVAWNRPELIGRALDSGAGGVIVPMVQDAEDARAAAAAARYPPDGARSFGPRRGAFGVTAGYLDADVGEQPLCLVMIESASALADAARIAATAGVDGVFVGPFDLSLALGLPLDDLLADRSPGSPLGRIVSACRDAGVIAAAYAGTPERARTLAGHGFTLVAATTDDELLASGYPRLRAELG